MGQIWSAQLNNKKVQKLQYVAISYLVQHENT